MEKKLKWIKIDIIVIVVLIILGNISTVLNISDIPRQTEEEGILTVIYSRCFPIVAVILLLYSHSKYKTDIMAASTAELIVIIMLFINSTISLIMSTASVLLMSQVSVLEPFILITILISLLPFILPTILLVDVIKIRKLFKSSSPIDENKSKNTTIAIAIGAIIFFVIMIVAFVLSIQALKDVNNVDSQIVPTIDTNNNIMNTTNDIVNIQFKDAFLYNAIKNQITNFKETNDSSLTICLTTEDINKITSLTFTEFTGSGIKDITGLRYFKALTKLKIQDSNYLTDISELAYLTALEELYIDNNKMILDISPISSLTNLKKLDLDYNNSMKNIKNINAIANLTKLEYLDTSVYNMNYTIDISKNNVVTFKLPAIFDIAQTNGANIKLESDKTLNVIQINNNEIIISGNDNGIVSVSISGGVYDKVVCIINCIAKENP